MVKWVRSLHTKVSLLWESQGQTREGEEGKQKERGNTQALCANYGHK